MKTNLKGFSIIEVLVAIIILAAVSVMVQETSTTSISSAEHISQKTASAWIARDRIAELRVKLRLMGSLSDSDFDMRATESLGVKYTSDIQLDKSTKYVQRLTVRVFTEENQDIPLTSVTAFLPVIKGVI